MGFYALASNSLVAEYILKHREKEQQPFSIKPDCRRLELDFPIKGSYLHYLLSYMSGSLQAKGGVILAHALQKVGRDFSFWTSDLHHGGEGISHAYTLDLLCEEEIIQVIKSDNHSYSIHESMYMARLRSECDSECDSEQHYIDQSKEPVAQSINGRVIVADKHSMFHKDGRFRLVLVPKFDKVIEIASAYQQQGE